MFDDTQTVYFNGPQFRKVQGLLEELADVGDDWSEQVTLGRRQVFEFGGEALYVSITRGSSGGHRAQIQAYIAEDGTEIVRRENR